MALCVCAYRENPKLKLTHLVKLGWMTCWVFQQHNVIMQRWGVCSLVVILCWCGKTMLIQIFPDGWCCSCTAVCCAPGVGANISSLTAWPYRESVHKIASQFTSSGFGGGENLEMELLTSSQVRPVLLGEKCSWWLASAQGPTQDNVFQFIRTKLPGGRQ